MGNKKNKDLRKSPAQAAGQKVQPQKDAAKKPAKPSERKPSALVIKIGLFIFFVGFLIYVQTLKYDFTLDDRIVVFENQLTTQGIKAIPAIFSKPYLYGSVIPDDRIYRPVSKSLFALCWSVSPDNPMIFHLLNVLFYALTGLMLFLTLVRYFPKYIYVPLITTLLFITHPIHTEVVDNVKSLDEILCFFFFIVSLFFIHKYLAKGKTLQLFIAAICFFISFLSKESGIAYLAVFPLIAFFAGAKKSAIIRISAVMIFVVTIVFALRYIVLGSTASVQVLPGDNIMAGTGNFLVQRATAVYLMGKYLLLLIFPHPLVCDYSTQQLALVSPGDWRFIISLILFLGFFVYAVWKFMKRDWIAFGILFFMISFSVTSNIFFLGGSHFAERFMYAPLLGFCIVIGVVLNKIIDKQKETEKVLTPKDVVTIRPWLFSAMALIGVLFVIKTIAQNPVWENNVALFEHGIKYSPQSYRVHIALAEDLTNEKYLAKFNKEEQQKIKERAIREIKTGLGYNNYFVGYDLLGTIFYSQTRYDSSFFYYKKGLEVAPNNESLNFHTGKALDKLSRFSEAIPYLNKVIAKNPKNDGALFNLGLSYTNLGDANTGLKYFLQITQLNPKRADAWYYAGLIFQAKGDNSKAKEYLDRASSLGGLQEGK